MRQSQRRHRGTVELTPSTRPGSSARRQISVAGIVQGVGFRPFVFRLAKRLELAGFVRNTPQGVPIEVQGFQESLDRFEEQLRSQAPVLSRIESLQSASIPAQSESDFWTLKSEEGHTGVPGAPPDVASCPACIAEAVDPRSRRFQYPFTTCTDCGPRYSILRDLPYDRPRTTMGDFMMCGDCRAENDEPSDRRFHAQTNACPLCGPRLRLIGGDGDSSQACTSERILEAVANLITSGKIVALKGLGGYQLICDGRNSQVVQRLRERKQGGDKPFAVMV